MKEKETPWYENKEIWEDWLSPALVERAPKEVDKIESLLDLEEESNILDLCCGVGRHSVELAKRGHNIIGVDITEYYLEKAEDKAKEEDVEVEFVEEDMREYRQPNSFDVVLNLADSFGYFQDKEENVRVLENVYDTLKSGGKFIIEVTGKEVFAGMFEEKDWRKTDEGYLLSERSVENDWEVYREKRIKISEGEVKEYESRFTIYSGRELKEMLKDVGFSKVELHGSFDGDPYDQKANRLVAVAKK